MTPADILKQSVSELQQALLSQHPAMPTLLKEIHARLKEDPELVTILEPQEVGVIFQGLMNHTAVTIATAKVKSKKAKINAADL